MRSVRNSRRTWHVATSSGFSFWRVGLPLGVFSPLATICLDVSLQPIEEVGVVVLPHVIHIPEA